MIEYALRMPQPWSIDLPRFGDAKQFAEWLQEQLAKCDDEAFGRRFAASCPVAGIPAEAYLHRKLMVCEDTLLVGIRFKGCDVAQPFVDLLAWTGEPQPGWVPAISEAFSPFHPFAVRFCTSRDSELPWPGQVDQYVYAGRARGALHKWVTPACDLSWFDDFRGGFERWQTASPLGPEVWRPEVDELQACLDDGHVVVAARDGAFLGVAACRRNAERAFKGWSIVEEFVVPEMQGQGLGAALQRGLMQRLPAGDLVWGTIHAKNFASQATAARCGRRVVETWWFTALREV